MSGSIEKQHGSITHTQMFANRQTVEPYGRQANKYEYQQEK